VEPLGSRLTFGLGLSTPFGLATEWDDPEIWSGQFISIRADLQAIDLNPNIAWQVTEKLGIGGGIVLRGSTVELERNIPAVIPYPTAPRVGPVAAIELESDYDTGVGFNLGLLHKPTEKLSWGLSYRSPIEIEYGGDGSFTQIPIDCTPDPSNPDPNLPQFCIDYDATVAGTLPFGQALPISTKIEFPAMASLGVAYRISPKFLVEGDLNWAGWSSFDTTEINFSGNPQFDSTIVSNWDDVMNYRFGLRWDVNGPGEWRFGAYYDQTPQPDESVGPLLPDADRTGLSAGYGRPLGKKTTIDLSVLYIRFSDRTTTVNNDGFDGRYKTRVWLAGVSIGF
jgi:long-chain fatty acid transport protein